MNFSLTDHHTAIMYNPQEPLFNSNATAFSNASGVPIETAGGAAVPDPTGAMARLIFVWCLPPILVVGTVGNILCLVVLQRKAMQTTPSSTYLMCLATADTILLYISAAKTWIRLVAGFELLHVADGVCRVVKYLFFTSSHLCAWLVVFLSLERFLVVIFPFHAGNTALVQRPGLVTVILLLVIMLINVNVIWTSKLIHLSSGQPSCQLYSEGNWMCRALPIINTLLYSALPSLLILSLNIAIIVQVLRSMRSVRQARLLSEQSSSSKSGAAPTVTTHGSGISSVGRSNARLSSKTQRKLTATLMVICVSWLLLSTPYCLMDNIHALKTNILVRTIAYLLIYVNHAINFYIYCLTGQKFRHELLRAFGCRQQRLSQHKHKFVQPKFREPEQPCKSMAHGVHERKSKLRCILHEERKFRQGGKNAHLYN